MFITKRRMKEWFELTEQNIKQAIEAEDEKMDYNATVDMGIVLYGERPIPEGANFDMAKRIVWQEKGFYLKGFMNAMLDVRTALNDSIEDLFNKNGRRKRWN